MKIHVFIKYGENQTPETRDLDQNIAPEELDFGALFKVHVLIPTLNQVYMTYKN